jgi:hypothetical protein
MYLALISRRSFFPSVVTIMSLSILPRSLLILSLGILLGTSATYLLTNTTPTPSQSVPSTPTAPEEDIVDGVEGLIGNTKLVRIRSLSLATGCEILAKAEVPSPPPPI